MEAVGLTLSALTLFDTAVNAIERIEAASTYGEDWQRSMFKIELLRIRLTNWGDGAEIAKNPELAGIAKAEDQEKAKELLGYIKQDLEDAEKLSEGYLVDMAQKFEKDESIATMTAKLRNLALKRQKNTSILKKAKWVLRDKRKLGILIKQLSDSIGDLIDVFSGVKQELLALAQKDAAEELIQPAETEEPETPEGLTLLSEAAQEVYPEMKEALDRIGGRETGGHVFGRATMMGNGTIHDGTYIASGFEGPTTGIGRRGNTYGDVSAGDNAMVWRGDSYGGHFLER